MSSIKFPIELDEKGSVKYTIDEKENIRLSLIQKIATPNTSLDFNRNFGSNLHNLIFQPNDEVLKRLIKYFIYQVLENEQKITISKTNLQIKKIEKDKIDVFLSYQLITDEVDDLKFNLTFDDSPSGFSLGFSFGFNS